MGGAAALIRGSGDPSDPDPSPFIVMEDAPPSSGPGTAPPAAAMTPHGQGKRGDGKPNVSHSTVEKQRRDRINSLIDELRELIPPQAGSESDPGAADAHGSDASKLRPKHSVLSDAISLVKELRTKLAAVEAEVARLQLHEAACPFLGNECAAEAAAAAAAAAAPRHAGPSQPQSASQRSPKPGRSARRGTTPAAAAAATAATAALALTAGPPPALVPADGVQVDPGEGCLYVKVHCRDRHGLLSDIVRTLKAIPLEITTAAITTTTSNGVAKVYDVFQVVPAPGTPTASAEDIRTLVEEAMGAGAGEPAAAAGKRPRRGAAAPA